jgi:hypothetical protein
LRLEIRFKIDKKKMNFIFHRREKIFLTKKLKRACAREEAKMIIQKFLWCSVSGTRAGIAVVNYVADGISERHFELTKTVGRRNFLALRMQREHSANHKCS